MFFSSLFFVENLTALLLKANSKKKVLRFLVNVILELRIRDVECCVFWFSFLDLRQIALTRD